MVFYTLIFLTVLTFVVFAEKNLKHKVASENAPAPAAIDAVILTIAPTIFSAALSFILLMGLAYSAPLSTGSPSMTLPLKALSNSSSTSGSFFLGSGTINGEQVFEYVVEREDGGFNLRSIPVSDNVTVYEDATASTATYVEYTQFVNESWLAPFSIDMYHAIGFHIPPGSLNQEYEISVTDR